MTATPSTDENELVLYQGAISTCSQKVRLALAEKGLSFRIVDMNVPAGEHLTPAYLALNPNGVVPTLVHRGRAVTDSSVICEYLDDVFTAPPLAPADPYRRAAMRSWMRYFEEVPTAAIRVPSYNRVLIRDFAKMAPDRIAAFRTRSPLRRDFYRDLTPQGFDRELYDRSIARLRGCLERVSGTLGDGRAFLLGEDFTIADIVLLPTIVRMVDIGLSNQWDDLPAIADWLERCSARPSFATAYYSGSRLAVPQTAGQA